MTANKDEIKEPRIANTGLSAMAERKVNSEFVYLINFGAGGQESASNPPLRRAKPL